MVVRMEHFEDKFEILKSLLGKWTAVTYDQIPLCSGVYGRIYQLLRTLHEENELAGWMDFICLIRHVLCVRESHEGIATLNVPSISSWPSHQVWQDIGVNVLSENKGYFKVEAAIWIPSWLDPEDGDLFAEVYKGKNCRPNLEIPADSSFAAATGFENYSSPGQREAVRALFFMKPGSTVIVNLPTGSGKSLVGYMPSLSNPHDGHLTVFIVPTISLAMDQERQFRGFKKTNHPLAWHSGLSKEDKEHIKQNIRAGTQPILFSSPESICGSLRMALYDAALRGFLRYFIVDETHLVTQWGDEFRPDFQAIAGIRRLLLRVCPNQLFRTVLMSATITEETFQTLEILFDFNESSQIISAVSLRSEPHYWIQRCKNQEEKKKQIIETVKHGPRPFLLYVTEPKEAKYWLQELRNVGFNRLRCFHGKTKTSDRQQIVTDWEQETVDGIVATSAFGVGMDKSDVRMVIHGCVPESLDRFYQEVGRSGRDGCPSLSLTAFDQVDYQKAEGMVIPKIITENIGLTRWKNLISKAVKVDGNAELIRLDLTLVPFHLNKQNDANKAWNLRTILLLARARILELDAEPLQAIEEYESEEERKRIVESYFNHIVIRINEPNHCEEYIWERLVAQERVHSIERSKRNFNLLKDVILHKREIGKVLCELYQISRSKFRVPVTWRCGSCPICRRDKSGYQPFSSPVVVPLAFPDSFVNLDWKNPLPMLSNDQPVIILCKFNMLDRNEREFMSVLEEVVRYFGIYEVAIQMDCSLNKNKKFGELHKKTKNYFLLNTLLNNNIKEWSGIPLPLVSILLPWEKHRKFPEELLFMMRPLHIIFVRNDVKDMQNPLRKLADTYRNIITFNDMKMRLSNVHSK